MKQLTKTTALLLSITLLQSTLRADDGLLSRATNTTTIAVVGLDSKQAKLSPKLEKLASSMGSKELLQLISGRFQQVCDLLDGETGYFAFDLPYRPRTQARIITPIGIPEDKLESLAQSVWTGNIGATEKGATWRIAHLGTSAHEAGAFAPESKLGAEMWDKAMTETGTFPMQLAVVYPLYLRETYAEIDPALPEFLGGGSTKVVVSDVEWISIGIEPDKITFRVVAQTTSPGAAEALKNYTPKLLRAMVVEVAKDDVVAGMMTSILGLLQPRVEGSQVILSIEDPAKTEAILQLVMATLGAAAEPMAVRETQNKLKTMGLAFHNYESAFRVFPTYAEMQKNKKPSGLSWRVHVLPFMGMNELYSEFKLDEPWDSEHNIKLLDRMPEIYESVIPIGSKETVKEFHTTFVAPVGEKTIFGQDKKITFSQLTDGSSNTILFLEVSPEHAIPWTSPEEYPYDVNDPVSKLRVIEGKVSVSMADGSVQRMAADKPAEVWNALITRNGGEVIQYPID